MAFAISPTAANSNAKAHWVVEQARTPSVDHLLPVLLPFAPCHSVAPSRPPSALSEHAAAAAPCSGGGHTTHHATAQHAGWIE